jgi:hypothetical protein
MYKTPCSQNVSILLLSYACFCGVLETEAVTHLVPRVGCGLADRGMAVEFQAGARNFHASTSSRPTMVPTYLNFYGALGIFNGRGIAVGV